MVPMNIGAIFNRDRLQDIMNIRILCFIALSLCHYFETSAQYYAAINTLADFLFAESIYNHQLTINLKDCAKPSLFLPAHPDYQKICGINNKMPTDLSQTKIVLRTNNNKLNLFNQEKTMSQTPTATKTPKHTRSSGRNNHR